MVEKISKTTDCVIKIWKIIVVGKNMEFYRFRIFEYLNHRIFEFLDFRISYLKTRYWDAERQRPSKIYYMQNHRNIIMINPLLGNPSVAKGKHYIVYNFLFLFCKVRSTLVYKN